MKILAFQELHHQVRPAVGGLIEVDHLDDVRVAKAGNDLGLAGKSLHGLAVPGGLPSQELEGVSPLHPRVANFIDVPHRALSDPADDAVGSEHRPGR
jgi:hypothetical protein